MMNIQLLTPKFSLNQKELQKTHNRPVMQSNLNDLTADTVSFSGKEQVVKNSVTTFKEIISGDYEKRMPSYHIIANRLMDTLDAVARELAEFGVTFDRAYCEKNPVKKANSFISKLIRSGEAPLDRVRATLYSENIYDLSIVNDKILPALEKRGYVISLIPDKMSGRKVLSSKPDFDVRLDIPEDARKQLSADLRNVASFKQLSSGYRDIQFRLEDTLYTGKEKTPIEILIVAGKNTSKAKELESYYVYDITRKLSKEMHISRIENPGLNSPALRVKNNIGIITQQLNDYISKPLFTNAANLDIYQEKTLLPVKLPAANCKTLLGLFEGIRTKIPIHYNARIEEVKSDEYKPILEKLVKASEEYKKRDDKTVYIDDIIEKRAELIKMLKQYKKDDLTAIRTATERFKETVQKFGEKTKTEKTK